MDSWAAAASVSEIFLEDVGCRGSSSASFEGWLPDDGGPKPIFFISFAKKLSNSAMTGFGLQGLISSTNETLRQAVAAEALLEGNVVFSL